MKKKKSAEAKSLTKKAILEALAKIAVPSGSSQPDPIKLLLTKWEDWKRLGAVLGGSFSGIRYNKEDRKKWEQARLWATKTIAYRGDDGTEKTIIDKHSEDYDKLIADTARLVEVAILREDAEIFRDIAAAFSKRKREKSKRKPAQKTPYGSFPIEDFLMLKAAYEGKENVTRTAEQLVELGHTASLDSIVRDLRRRRRELKLRDLSR
jgi:hypothetical protein